ncbi:Piso0_005350 [Millerozyma farinosa CBS 7064]|uniref:Piso0_005350 protein n=1 Tax=Pichia sorbitophila (strain ATCC MYA-4447 / BCRC 22081 / CBS 7064 / NBRC 10061 / NRRL Y-12695) TaxID=559304 RepID=G8Y4W0_PICSO|nr:Piso0_005350 [Millerozyma farinosa CBS 7064]
MQKQAAKSKENSSTEHGNNSSRVRALLDKYVSQMRQSELVKETLDLLHGRDITKIRCLALGSPFHTINALYQLAYLAVLAEGLGIEASDVSLFDPVFDEHDRDLLSGMKYEVSERYDETDSRTLYFLPHAPLDLTNHVLAEFQPHWLLGNDVAAHTDRLTKKELHEKYPLISLLNNLVATSEMAVRDSGFVSVSGRKKNRKRQNKLVYEEPKIEYDYENMYFNSATIVRLKNIEGCWGNSFTDLALHHVEKSLAG